MSLKIWLRMGLVAGLATSTLGLGCGDDDAGGGSNADGGDEPRAGNSGGGSGTTGGLEPGRTVSEEISAADGGEVMLGAVKLSIPAGALPDDTEITVEVLDKDDQPDADTIVADVFDFGPDGLEFTEPVTLEFDVAGLDVPSDMQAQIAFLDGSKWTTLEDSALEGDTISATTTHFTPFTVVLVLRPDGTIDQTGGSCPTEDFDACGGDLEGTWVYSAACATVPPGALGGSGDGGDNPFSMCADQPMFSITLDLTGETTFDADGSFTLDQMLTTSSEIVIPASCVEQLVSAQPGADPATACEMLLGGMTDTDGNCKSAGEDPETKASMETGTWSADNGMLTIVSMSADGGTTEEKNEEVLYCVNGDTVTVVVRDLDKGVAIRYTATRQ